MFGQWLLHAEGQNSQSLTLPLLEGTQDSWGKTAGRSGKLRSTFVPAQDEALRGLRVLSGTPEVSFTGRITTDRTRDYQGWSKDNCTLLLSERFYYTVSGIPYEMPQTCNECMEQNQPYTISAAFNTERKTDGLAPLHLGQQLRNYEPTVHLALEGKQTFQKKLILITRRPQPGTITVPNSQERFGCRPPNAPKWWEIDGLAGEVRGQRAAESPITAVKANVAFSVQSCRAHAEARVRGG